MTHTGIGQVVRTPEEGTPDFYDIAQNQQKNRLVDLLAVLSGLNKRTLGSAIRGTSSSVTHQSSPDDR